jgi:hypothetical protein
LLHQSNGSRPDPRGALTCRAAVHVAWTQQVAAFERGSGSSGQEER